MLGLTTFSLTDLVGQQVSFPGNRPSLVCFVKEDCPTCRTVMPVLASLYEAFADHVDFFVVGQTADGNQILAEEFKLPFSCWMTVRSRCLLPRTLKRYPPCL